MNKSFLFFLFVFTCLLIFHTTDISIYGVHLPLPPATIYILFVIIMLFIYWKIKDIQSNKAHKFTLEFRKHVRKYLEKNGASKKENLLDDFPGQIHPTKDLYILDDKLIMQTENQTINGVYSPGGYVLKLSKIFIYWLYFRTAIKIFFEYQFFWDFIFLFWGLLLVFICLVKTLYKLATSIN